MVGSSFFSTIGCTIYTGASISLNIEPIMKQMSRCIYQQNLIARDINKGSEGFHVVMFFYILVCGFWGEKAIKSGCLWTNAELKADLKNLTQQQTQVTECKHLYFQLESLLFFFLQRLILIWTAVNWGEQQTSKVSPVGCRKSSLRSTCLYLGFFINTLTETLRTKCQCRCQSCNKQTSKGLGKKVFKCAAQQTESEQNQHLDFILTGKK